MIINFYNVGGGGGGGTTNYNQLENKPQINGVTLSGNVSSDQLGITPNELKAVENVPSAATNGSVFAVASGSNMSLKQAYNVTEQMSTEWAFWGGQTSQGKAENTEFRMPTNFVMPSGETVVSNLTYYDIPINTYWDGTQFKVEYSLDSGTTWQWAFSATTFGGGDGPVTVGPSEGMGKTCELSYSWYYYGDVDKNCFKLSSNKSLSHPVVNNFTNEYDVLYFDTFLKSGSSYNLLSNKPSINGVELIGNKSKSDLGLNANKLYSGARTNIVLQKEVNGTRALAWENENYVDFSIDWDGHSDMLLSFNWDDGLETGQTAYFSGGTWFNLDNPDWYRISNGKIYFHRSDYTQLTSIAQGSLSSAVTFYKNVLREIDGELFESIGDFISVYNEPSNSNNWYTFVSGASRNVKLDNVSDGNLTINYGDNFEETIEILNGNWGDTTGCTWESDHYYKYTPDMGKLMIFHYGSFYWEIRGGSGKLFINNPDVNGLASSISAKEAYEPMFGPYTYNGAIWEKI